MKKLSYVFYLMLAVFTILCVVTALQFLIVWLFYIYNIDSKPLYMVIFLMVVIVAGWAFDKIREEL